MPKESVTVSAIIAEEEYIFPIAVSWPGGHAFDIDRILHVEHAQGETSYTISLCGLRRRLLHAASGSWYLQ